MQHHSFFRGEKFVSVQEITGLATIISHDYNNSVKYTNAYCLMMESESYNRDSDSARKWQVMASLEY